MNLVIAESYKHYRNYINRFINTNNTNTDFIFLQKEKQLKGLDNIIIHLVGDYWLSDVYRCKTYLELKHVTFIFDNIKKRHSIDYYNIPETYVNDSVFSILHFSAFNNYRQTTAI